MEREAQRLSDGLTAVAGRGDSGLFSKLKAMAAEAQGVVARARDAGSEAERRRVLEEGLGSKAAWLDTLQDYALGLKREADEDQGQAAGSLAGGAVSILTARNFSDFVAAHPHAMVEFYAPWCPHCKRFAPEYESCAKSLQDRAAFAVVDGDTERQLKRVYGIGGFPTLKWFAHGRPIEYEGPRSAEALSAWIEERLKPAYVDIGAGDDLATALEEGGSVRARICAGEGSKESARYSAFTAAAEHFRGRVVFTWAPAAEGGGDDAVLRLHRTGLPPEVCGTHAGGAPDPSTCRGADEVIAWLEERLAFDQ